MCLKGRFSQSRSHIHHDYSLTDSSFITLSTNGSKMVFKPYIFIKRDSTAASNSIHFNLDHSAGVIRSAGVMFLSVKWKRLVKEKTILIQLTVQN